MRLENEQGWIEIEFEDFAENATCRRNDLFDERNSVEIGINFSIEGIGWGCVGDEYFQTTDIKSLATGTAEVLFSKTNQFLYSVAFPYGILLDNVFCKFHFSRCEEGITANLQIWDGLCEYIEITQTFDEISFEAIVQEFKEVSQKFPVR